MTAMDYLKKHPVPDGWRIVAPGETIIKGDRFLCNGEHWDDVARRRYGDTVHFEMHVVIRKIEA